MRGSPIAFDASWGWERIDVRQDVYCFTPFECALVDRSFLTKLRGITSIDCIEVVAVRLMSWNGGDCLLGAPAWREEGDK